MYTKIRFKGQEFEQGDIVAIIAGSFPFEFHAAVVDYDESTETLEVMSTQLVVTQHNGLFTSSDVESIKLIFPYDEGLPLEARATLRRGQLCLVNGKWTATVTAAIDGVVTGRSVGTPGVNDGTSITGGSSFWQAA